MNNDTRQRGALEYLREMARKPMRSQDAGHVIDAVRVEEICNEALTQGGRMTMGDDEARGLAVEQIAETWEESWHRASAAEQSTWAEVVRAVEPECLYWSDGHHCYAQGIMAPDGDLERRFVHKTCACGHMVKPR